jgi:F0F1-type ATP synthase membrane subunit a
MNWIAWLSLAVIVCAVAAVTGFKPRGTRHVAHSRMMGAGRVCLVILVVIFAVMAFRAHGG